MYVCLGDEVIHDENKRKILTRNFNATINGINIFKRNSVSL